MERLRQLIREIHHRSLWQVLGTFALLAAAELGGMATVYLADDLKHERKVALKVLKPELATLVGAERFLAEIKTDRRTSHEWGI